MVLYDDLQTAFEFYNQYLFDDKLPNCIITLQRQKNTKGYFSPNRFINEESKYKHEISLNPQYFATQEIEKVLSTLVHEMCHLHQEYLKNKSAAGYHDKKWADDMERVGLMPSDTAKEGGKKTGFKVSHYINESGQFQKFTKELLETGFNITWKEKVTCCFVEKTKIIDLTERNMIAQDCKITEIKGSNMVFIQENKTGGKRVKYTCGCSNIWGKEGLDLHCNNCNNDFKAVVSDK